MSIASNAKSAGPPSARRRARSATLALACFGVALAAPVRADLWVKERITGANGKLLGERTWTFASGMIRFDQGKSGFVLDSNRESGWLFGGDAGGCERLPAPGTGSSAETPKPPTAEEQRYAAILGELSNGPLQVVPRDERRTIAALEAQRFDVVRDGVAIQTRWYASALENAELDAVVQRLLLSGRLNALQGLDAAQIALQSIGHGYPVRVEDAATGVVIEAVEIRTGKQPSSAFTPPPVCTER